MSKPSVQSGFSPSPYARRGQVLRCLYLLVAACCWLMMRLTRRPGGCVVLCYHAVCAGQLRRFARQMRHVARRAVSITGAAPAAGSADWPRVCITFDDGFEGVLTYALPCMQALGVPAALFVVPGNLGKAPRWPMPADHPDRGEVLAGAAEVAAAVGQGLCSVGSHTLTHARLTSVTDAQLTRELCESRRILEKLLDREITELAFPYGDYDANSAARALETGYSHLFTLDPLLWHPGQDHVIGRFLASPDMWRLEFMLTCAGAYAWLAGWRRLLWRMRGKRRLRRPAVQEAVSR